MWEDEDEEKRREAGREDFIVILQKRDCYESSNHSQLQDPQELEASRRPSSSFWYGTCSPQLPASQLEVGGAPWRVSAQGSHQGHGRGYVCAPGGAYARRQF